MKRILFTWVILATAMNLFAQTPPYHKGTGTGGNTIPMNTAGSHCQQIYEPTDFNIVPISGLITKIYFRNTAAGASGTYTNFSVSFLQNSMTAFPNNTFLTGFTNALSAPTITINGNATAGGWYEIPLSTPFAYDNNQTLIVEIKYDSRTGGMSNPTSTASGNKRLSIINAPGPATGNLSTIWGDFGMEVIPATPCAGATGGVLNPSVTTTCPSVNFNITSTGVTIGTNTLYQWQTSTNGLIWNDVPGQTFSSFSGSQTSANNYRLRVICTNSQDTAYSNSAFVDIQPFLNCYCTSNATATTNSSIRNVTFANINNTSAGACSQYTDYTSVQTVVNMGLSYPISVLTEDCEGTTFGTQRVAVFIDWNQNGLFTDPGELVWDPGTLPGAATVQFSGSVSVPVTATPGITKMRVINVQATGVINPCGTYTTGETEDYLINVQPLPANEAGVLAITKPELAACSLGQQLWVDLQNLGTSPLTSANFTVKVNGLNIPVNNPWTGNIPPSSVQEIMIPVNYIFGDGDSVHVEVTLPNGVAEDPVYSFNNTSGRRLFAALSGIKTVYGPGANFADMNAAIQAINIRGVCDTVYFKIASNTYTTQHTFTEYPNAGPGRLVVFESATGNAADVTFSFPATAAGDNFVFLFDGGDGYMIRNLRAIATGTAFSRVIDIRNGANDLTFENNIFIGDTAASYVTDDFTKIVVASANGTNDHRTVLRNNHIMGGNRGINLGGIGVSNYETGNVVEGNLIEKYNYIGAIFGNLAGFRVSNNTFIPRTSLTQDAYGPYVNTSILGGNITNNTINSNRPGAGIHLINAKGSASEFLVANNFIYLSDPSASTISRGITITDPNSLGIIVANNSISVSSENPAGGAITVLDGSDLRFYNNNIGSFGAAPVVRIEKSYSVAASDNNNLFGTTISNILGTSYATLAQHKAVTGKDVSSISVNPGYNGADLHTCEPALNAAAMPLASVTMDYDGDNRSATPDIGADEFMGDANELLLVDEFLKCPTEQVSLGNVPVNGVTYSWSPSGNTSQISTTNAGVFIITATSSCGIFKDTATVTNKPLPTASFTTSSVGLTGLFTNTSSNGTTYLWDFGDGNTSTDENPNHVYTSAGTYSVTLTVTNECGTSTFGPVAVNVVNVGIEENDNIQFTLFPNPTNGEFTVLLGSINNQVVTTITVIDVTGKVVLLNNIPQGTNLITLDASSFASGVYSVKIKHGEHSKTMRLIRK